MREFDRHRDRYAAEGWDEEQGELRSVGCAKKMATIFAEGCAYLHFEVVLISWVRGECSPQSDSIRFHLLLPHSISADRRHTQVTARAVDKKWNYVDKKSSWTAGVGERWGRREHGVPGSSRQNVGCQLAVCQLGGLRWRAWVMVLPVASRCQADALAAGPDATVSTHACTHTYAKRAALIAVLSVCPAGKSFSCLVPSRTHITWPREIEKWQLPER